MLTLPCPSCGGPLNFRSKTSLFTVCEYCRSSIIKKNADIESIGKMAELPADLSPIQIGSRGRFKGSRFYVAGRIIYSWDDGTWNEWYLLFDNGKTGWLAEAQGEFIISFPLEGQKIPPIEFFAHHKHFKVDSQKFSLSDRKNIHYIGSEGELPFKALKDYKSTVCDFLSKEDDLFLTIEYPAFVEKPFAYVGKYTSLKRLKMENIRLLEGWS